jgi:hypothetical protein
MDKARKMCGRMEVWSRATYEELDILLQACNRNWRKPATLLSGRRVSNQHLRNRELYVEEVQVGGPKRKESLDVVDVGGVFVCLGRPTSFLISKIPLMICSISSDK